MFDQIYIYMAFIIFSFSCSVQLLDGISVYIPLLGSVIHDDVHTLFVESYDHIKVQVFVVP